MEVSIALLQQVANESAQLGALSAMIRLGAIKPYLNKTQAFKIYGRSKVESWLKDGHIRLIKDGDHSAAWRLDRIQLDTLEKAEKLLNSL
jgi:hypothetical protein